MSEVDVWLRARRIENHLRTEEENKKLLEVARTCPHEMKDIKGADIDNKKPSKSGLFSKGTCNTLGSTDECITCDLCGLHVHILKRSAHHG